MNYVLDTNVILYHLTGRLVNSLPLEPLFVSIITEVELMAFKALTPTETAQIQLFLYGVTVVPFDQQLKQAVINMRLAGLRMPDAVVAAPAVNYGAVLLTHDVRLHKLAGLQVVAPPLKP